MTPKKTDTLVKSVTITDAAIKETANGFKMTMALKLKPKKVAHQK